MLKALSLQVFFPSSPSAGKRTYVKAAVHPGLFWLGTALVMVNAVLLFSYLAGVNSRSLQGYEIKQSQNKIAALSEENKKLDLKLTEATSILSIQQSLAHSDYVTMGTPKFLEVETNQYTYNRSVRP